MGLTSKRLTVKSSRTSRKAIAVDFLMDSGAVYSLVPGKQLRKIGIHPYKSLEFVLADGTKVTRKIGDAYFEYRGEGGAAPVIFGEAGDQPLLGATTLESLALILNPFQRQLHPMKLVLMRLSRRWRRVSSAVPVTNERQIKGVGSL